MLDQTPGEIITALRGGEIDLALTVGGAGLLSRDFYTQKLASVPSLVTLPLEHPLASEKRILISKLKTESFVQVPECVGPGYNQRIARFCLRFGKFRPRFVSIGVGNSLEEGLVISANEGTVSLQPSFISHLRIPNVVMVPIAEKRATWDLFIAWQKRENVQPFACLAGKFSTQGQVLREQVEGQTESSSLTRLLPKKGFRILSLRQARKKGTHSVSG